MRKVMTLLRRSLYRDKAIWRHVPEWHFTTPRDWNKYYVSWCRRVRVDIL